MRDDVTAYQILEWSLWNDGTTKSAEGLENFYLMEARIPWKIAIMIVKG